MTQDNQANRTTTKKAPAKATTKEAPAKATTKKAPAKASTKKAPARTRGRPPSHEAIAKRAHELYEAQGGGDDVAHWLQAERELSSH